MSTTNVITAQVSQSFHLSARDLIAVFSKMSNYFFKYWKMLIWSGYKLEVLYKDSSHTCEMLLIKLDKMCNVFTSVIHRPLCSQSHNL